MDQARTGVKIITVEDSAAVVQRLQQMLAEIDEVGWMANATHIAEALALVEAVLPDMAILDISLVKDAPKANGMDLLKILRRDKPQMTIVMLTNLAGDEYRKRCFDMGADYFLDKAHDFDLLPALIRSMNSGKS